MVEENIKATHQNQRRSEILDELDTLSRLLGDISIQCDPTKDAATKTR